MRASIIGSPSRRTPTPEGRSRHDPSFDSPAVSSKLTRGFASPPRSGFAFVGNVGARERLQYTALGDMLNTASRLEGLNKEYVTHILFSESTYSGIETSHFAIRELDLIRVKGKERPAQIYELMGRRDGATELAELAERFGKAREAYRRRAWREAARLFDEVLKRWPDDGPARVFRERVEECLAEEPAPDWDGVYVMKHK